MRIRMLSVNNSALKVKIILKNHVRTGFFLISMKKFVLNKISCYAKYEKLKNSASGNRFCIFHADPTPRSLLQCRSVRIWIHTPPHWIGYRCYLFSLISDMSVSRPSWRGERIPTSWNDIGKLYIKQTIMSAIYYIHLTWKPCRPFVICCPTDK